MPRHEKSVMRRSGFKTRVACRASSGLTLVELVIVLVILVALGSLMVPILSNSQTDAAEQTTKASLVAVRDALQQSWSDTEYVSLPGPPATTAIEVQRLQVRWLFENPVTGDASPGFDPDTRLGWNGPYLVNWTGRYQINAVKNLTAAYGTNGDPAILDTFTGTPIVIQDVDFTQPIRDVRIVSAGPNGVIDISPLVATVDLASEGGTQPVGDDLYVALQLR